MASVKDVARLAGVSLMTVSRALNTPGKLNQETLAKVLQAVETLGYVPSLSARKTRGGRSATESLQILQQGLQDADEVKQALVHIVGLYPPGTYVQLDNGEIAVVLRHGSNPQQPRIASVVDRDGQALYPPISHLETRGPRIVCALARSSLTLDLDLRSMVQLGAHNSPGSAQLRRMIQVPGSSRQ